MGQQEIIDVLKVNKKKKFTSSDLNKLLSIGQGSIMIACKKLRKTNFIKFEKIRVNGRNQYRYWM